MFRYWANPATSLWMRFRYSIRMFAGLGELALARGDLSAARSHSAQCLELATRTASRKNLVKGWRLAAEIAHAERDGDTPKVCSDKSLDVATSIGNPVQHWKAEIALGQFLQDAGRHDEAQHAFQRAFAVMQQVRHRLGEERLRVAFEKNPDLRLVQDSLSEASDPERAVSRRSPRFTPSSRPATRSGACSIPPCARLLVGPDRFARNARKPRIELESRGRSPRRILFETHHQDGFEIARNGKLRDLGRWHRWRLQVVEEHLRRCVRLE